jgi:hypothetical protein
MSSRKFNKGLQLLFVYLMIWSYSYNLYAQQITFEPVPDFFRIKRELPLIELSTAPTINVSDYGAIINDGNDDTQAITNALKFAEDNANASNPIEVKFETGVYDIGEPYINNADFVENNETHTFFIDRANHIVVNGNNAEILIHDPSVGFMKTSNSENIIIKDFIVDYSELPFTQGTIVEVNPGENNFYLEIDDGFPMMNRGHIRNAPERWGMLKNADGSLKDGAPNLIGTIDLDFQFITTRTFRYRLSNTDDLNYMEVGDKFVFIARYNGKTTFSTNNSKQVTYLRNTSYTSVAGSYNGTNNREWNVINCKLLLKPNSGRLHTANADGFHITSGIIGPWIQGCVFEGYSDDAMNLKHTRREILSVEAANRVKLKFDVVVGDTLRFYNPRDGIDLGTAIVTAVQNLGNNEFSATLSKSINITIASGNNNQTDDKCYIENRSSESFILRDNIFRNARRYGLLIQGTYGLVENNTFENLSTGGIKITNAAGWGEGFSAKNITINNNIFKNCGYDTAYLEDPKSAAISVYLGKLVANCSASETSRCDVVPTDWIGIENIKITNNNISYNKKAIDIQNVITGLIKCNTITPNNSFSGTNLGDVFLVNNENFVAQNEICSLSDTSTALWYVSANGNDETGSGSIGNAFATLSKAITTAADGDKIIIVGTINQNSQIAFNKEITFEGQSNAVIDGNTNRLFNITSNNGNSITFSNITFQSMNSAFQGAVLNNTSQSGMTFTFTNCNFLNNSTSDDAGGGVFYFGQDSTVNLTGCTFNNNAVVTSIAATARGGTISFNSTSTATITNSTFSNNEIAKNDAFGGAAIRVNNNGCNITISNSLFYNNKANNGTGDNSDFNGVIGATMNFTNSLAQFTNNTDTTTGSNLTADFSNTTFTFTSPNLTYTAANALTDATPIDFGSDPSDVGAWDSKINLFKSGATWNSAANWSGTVPTSTDNATFLSDSPATTIASSTQAVCNNLSVNASSSLTINGGSLIVSGTSTGNVTYNTALGTTNWYLIAAPVAGEIMTDMRANNSFANGTGGSRIGFATYDDSQAANSKWAYFNTSSTDALANGKGCSAKLLSTGNLGFTGTINTSDVTATVAFTGNGFNLLGNPYTSHMNGKTFLDANANLDQTQLWVWNQASSNYEVKTNASATILAPTQGFFVKANSGTQVSFAESNQVGTGGTFQRSATTELKLVMTDGQSNRFAKIHYSDQTTKGYDAGWEGEVFGGIPNSLDVFTHLVDENQGKKYQVQSLPLSELSSVVVPLGIIADAGKELRFSLETANFPSDVTVYLEDRLNNSFNKISNGKTFKITLDAASNDVGRFYVHASKTALSVADDIFESVSIYKTNNTTLRIAGLTQGSVTVKVFNILGKQVLNDSFVSNGVAEIQLPRLTTGVYIVQLQTANGNLNKKIILE